MYLGGVYSVLTCVHKGKDKNIFCHIRISIPIIEKANQQSVLMMQFNIEIGGLECAVYCSAIFFAAQLWAVKMADVGWQKLRVVVSQHRTYEGLLTNSRVNKGTMMF